MLNPESCDYNRGIIKLLFTDENAKPATVIYLTEEAAWRLHEMIQNSCNMKAREKRSKKQEQFDPSF